MPNTDKEAAFFRINMYIDLFRKHDFPIFRIYHYNKQHGLIQGTEDIKFPESVSIKPDDPMIIKTYPDSLNKTDLDNDAIMSPVKDHTTNIEIMFDAVGYDVIQLILENADQIE